jgi:arylsulfatase A-like enzyme
MGVNAIRRGDAPITESEYLTDAFNREAASFVERNHERPFFLYLAFNAVHTPQHVTPKYRDRFPDVPPGERRRMLAMLSAADDGVGALSAMLRKHGIDDDTLVFLISDNGGPPGNGTRNVPLRGHKGETLEGGIRVPFIVRWPAKVPAGRVDDRPVMQIDIVPTILAAAGAAPQPKPLDGKNLLPFLSNEQTGAVHEALFWRFGPRRAVRAGDWKLHWTGDGERRLYNLAKDVGETDNVAAANPHVVEKLSAQWAAWSAGLAEPLWPGRLEGDDGETPTTRRGRNAAATRPSAEGG